MESIQLSENDQEELKQEQQPDQEQKDVFSAFDNLSIREEEPLIHPQNVFLLGDATAKLREAKHNVKFVFEDK